MEVGMGATPAVYSSEDIYGGYLVWNMKSIDLLLVTRSRVMFIDVTVTHFCKDKCTAVTLQTQNCL